MRGPMSEQPNAIPLAKMSDINAHTPGPWAYRWSDFSDKYEVYEIYGNDDYGVGSGIENTAIAEINDLDDSEDDSQPLNEANARLIAAAPDMLAALQKIDADWAETFPDGPDGNRDWHGLGKLSDETAEVWRSIRAAIARATRT